MEDRQVTLRGTFAGLIIGSAVLFSNFQFGLQTGWVSMMSLPSALLGFAVFKSLSNHLSFGFTPKENVFIQSLAVAVGTGPLAFGLVGIVPALQKFMTKDEVGDFVADYGIANLTLWSFGLAFFGVFFAMMLRRQIIVKEKLPFPSGSATATMISVLHNVPSAGTSEAADEISTSTSAYEQNMRALGSFFGISAIYTVASYFVPIIRNLPVFGSYLAKSYMWTLQPSPAYIGQGIIMGLPTVSSMLFGAILGWAVLAPLAQHSGWATGPIDDWKTGAQGWILWISLAIMVADTVVGFLIVSVKMLIPFLAKVPANYQKLSSRADESNVLTPLSSSQSHVEVGSDDSLHLDVPNTNDDDSPASQLVGSKVVITGLVVSMIACLATTKFVFPVVPVYAIILAVLLAVFLSILGVRALGETDLNPVSGIGKISQVLFALVIPRSHPANVLVNLVAGGIAEAGAQQAGDLMQDLKTGYLLEASPKAQFIAQLIGSAWSAVLSAAVYKMYNAVYEIPGPMFRIPTAVIWIDCARLVTGEGLPEHAGTAAAIFGAIFGVISAVKNLYSKNKYVSYLPSGVAVGIGIYNTPSFTLARFIGGVIAYFWYKKYTDHDSRVYLIILSSGLVLGEGVLSIVTMILTSAGVGHF